MMLDKYFETIASEGLMGEFKFLDSSDEFYWVPPGFNSPITYDSVRKILVQSAGMFQSVENTWDTLKIYPLTASLPKYTGRLRSIIVDTAGRRTSMRLVETGIVIKREDGWKLLSEQTSLLPSYLD